MAKQRLKEIIKIRKDKIEKLRESGVDPYPSEVQGSPEGISKALKSEGKTVEVAGRIMGWREHGNVIFADLKDESGEIQLWFQKDNLKDKFKLLRYFDIGDFIYAKGKVTKTKAGEISIDAVDLQMLSKSIRPLPSTWHGLKDVEERYRKRYLDILINDDVKNRLITRTKIITAIREFLDKKGFIEVETPTLQPVYGGGFARPFKTFHNTLDSEFYLRISDEMYLKRLIVGGMEKVYEITKVFRNEGVDYDHVPEFTMFEAQIAYEDYEYGMDLIEEIFDYCANSIFGSTKFNYQNKEIDFKKPWERLKMVEAIEEYIGLKPLEWESLEGAKKAAKSVGIEENKLSELNKMQKIGEVIAFVFEETVEEKLIQPTIIYDYPVEVSPLAKKCEDERFTQRFEYFANGSELGNNYTELNDPIDLRQRFLEEKKKEEAGFEEAHQTDYEYLEAIEYGFPPTCGLSIGIDRMVMMMTDGANIKEVIPFPTLKPKHKKDTAKKKAKKVRKTSSEKLGEISEDLKKEHSGIFYAYTLIDGVEIQKKDKELEKLKKEIVASRKDMTMEEVRGLQPVKSYRKMLKKTGVDVGSRMPSPEALLKRIVKGKGLYRISTAVDAYNLAVIETGVGLGGFDFDKINPPVILRFSEKGEKMKLLGEGEITETRDGEIVYADRQRLLTLDLNYRDIDETKITMDTETIILFADGGPGIKKQTVVEALEIGAEYIVRFCGGSYKEPVLID